MDYNSELVYIREEKGRRQAIPEKMLEILIDELKSYKNAKFSVLFRLFLSTGMRVGEFKIFV
ncbi:hypothetical protein [Mycoplasmopsis caviae]|nr:hypothetical protein [Mycoplasmopsis caviae]